MIGSKEFREKNIFSQKLQTNEKNIKKIEIFFF